MVVEVEADLRHLGDHLDLKLLELLGTAEARQHQELRRVVGAAAHDHLALGAVHDHLAEARADHAHRAPVLEQDRERVHVRLDGQVRPAHDRVEVGDGGAGTRAVAMGHLVPADPVLLGAVEVLVRREAVRLRGVQEVLRERVARAALGHRERPAGTVVLVLAALVVLCALEVREHLVPGPAGPPLVVVERVPADVDHRVDRGGAAQHLPAREVDAAVVRERLVDRRVVPVLRGSVQRREGGGQVDELVRVRPAGLQQEDGDVRVLREAVGKHAAGRAGPDDHVVVHEPTLPLPTARSKCPADRHSHANLPAFMAVPKQRQSHARTNKRRSQHKIETPGLRYCPRCHAPRRPHRVCPNCGTYAGREVVVQQPGVDSDDE